MRRVAIVALALGVLACAFAFADAQQVSDAEAQLSDADQGVRCRMTTCPRPVRVRSCIARKFAGRYCYNRCMKATTTTQVYTCLRRKVVKVGCKKRRCVNRCHKKCTVPKVCKNVRRCRTRRVCGRRLIAYTYRGQRRHRYVPYCSNRYTCSVRKVCHAKKVKKCKKVKRCRQQRVYTKHRVCGMRPKKVCRKIMKRVCKFKTVKGKKTKICKRVPTGRTHCYLKHVRVCKLVRRVAVATRRICRFDQGLRRTVCRVVRVPKTKRVCKQVQRCRYVRQRTACKKVCKKRCYRQACRRVVKNVKGPFCRRRVRKCLKKARVCKNRFRCARYRYSMRIAPRPCRKCHRTAPLAMKLLRKLPIQSLMSRAAAFIRKLVKSLRGHPNRRVVRRIVRRALRRQRRAIRAKLARFARRV